VAELNKLVGHRATVAGRRRTRGAAAWFGDEVKAGA
jgi:hypothetical protein